MKDNEKKIESSLKLEQSGNPVHSQVKNVAKRMSRSFGLKSEKFLNIIGLKWKNFLLVNQDTETFHTAYFLSFTGDKFKSRISHRLRYILFTLKVQGFRFNSAFVLTLFTLLSACNNSFDPMQENDSFYFTIYGFLDARADTQWVRVAPAREKFDTSPEIPDMQVTLEHLEGGNKENMNTRLVKFQAGFNALNVWSLMDIEPGHSYRLKAERPDGKSSRVSVTLPDVFPTPRIMKVEVPTMDPEYVLMIDEVERLADVQSRWYVRLQTEFWEDKRVFRISNKRKVRDIGFGSYRLTIDPDEEMEYIKRQLLITDTPGSKIEFKHHQIYVASAGPEWDEEIDAMDELIYALPEGLSNVENGLGFMVGVISKLIPFETCLDEQGSPIACPEEEPFW